MIWIFLIGGLLLSLLCNELLLRFSQSLGIRNKNDVVIRWSNQSKPSLGGVSFFAVFVFATFAVIMLLDQVNIFHNEIYGIEFTGLFGASCLAFLMGLADDAYNTRPYFKLFVQITCGVFLISTGTVIDLFHQTIPDQIITVLWVVAVMNSLNMLDNMDGIAGTTVCFLLLTCMFSRGSLSGTQTDIWALIIMAIIGALIGFLRFNIFPSKIFMGDAGSQFIGLVVSFFAIKFLWNVGSRIEQPSWSGFLVTLVVFTPAAADTLTVVINRMRRGRSPMVGGKDHTTHHLVYAGLKDKQVWYVFTLISIFSTLLGIFMIDMVWKGVLLPVALAAIYFLVVFANLFRVTIKYPEPKKD
ncbi:MAG: MraY family glycosyltransferase [Bacteroidota bacterium]|jgi:UDP-GlcNAc:undecaprenyl-phosphate GlcNAc-1-phosphate transferase